MSTKLTVQQWQNDIPIEIIELVVGHSRKPELVNLALAGSLLGSCAERCLYSRISVDVLTEDHGALGTLATNATKAGYIRFLAVEFDPGMQQISIKKNAAVVDYLVTALWSTTSLVDLRLRLYRGNEESFTRISQSLL